MAPIRKEIFNRTVNLNLAKMIDIRKRSVMARTGTWKIGERQVELPGISFISTQRIRAPDSASMILAVSKEEDPRLTFVDQGSPFAPSEERGDVTIAPDFPYPMSLEDLEVDAGIIAKPANAVVVHRGRQIVSEEGIEILVVGNAVELIRHPKELVDEMVRLKSGSKSDLLIYLPGIATPSNIAFLTYCGADIFDSTRIIWESRAGHVLTPDGRWPRSHAEDDSFLGILTHNYRELERELNRTIHHIENGTLREFVEKRAVHDPWMIAALRHFDMRHYDFQELHFPITGPDFHANTKESLHRPDIIRYRKRIKERFRKPESARILLLLPCSAKKPYSLSRTHILYRKAVKDSGCQHLVHEVIITSPLGIVPRELELFYPAQNYDIPVTGHWSRDEIAMIQEDLLDLLDKNEYEHIIAHLGTEKDFVCEVLENHISTSNGSPTSRASLSSLTEELSGLSKQYPKVERKDRMQEDMTARCVFQFAKGGKELTRSVEIKGRYPNLKIFSDERQLGMLVEERGMISLTLDGAERISKADVYCVEIDDFHPQGNLFAIGVEDADRNIRIGDDVVIRHEKDVRAVGSAVMNWKEMVESNRGEAVRIRHKKKM